MVEMSYQLPDKVALDVEYLNRQSFWFDMKDIVDDFFKGYEARWCESLAKMISSTKYK